MTPLKLITLLVCILVSNCNGSPSGSGGSTSGGSGAGDGSGASGTTSSSGTWTAGGDRSLSPPESSSGAGGGSRGSSSGSEYHYEDQESGSGVGGEITTGYGRYLIGPTTQWLNNGFGEGNQGITWLGFQGDLGGQGTPGVFRTRHGHGRGSSASLGIWNPLGQSSQGGDGLPNLYYFSGPRVQTGYGGVSSQSGYRRECSFSGVFSGQGSQDNPYSFGRHYGLFKLWGIPRGRTFQTYSGQSGLIGGRNYYGEPLGALYKLQGQGVLELPPAQGLFRRSYGPWL